MKFQLFRYYLTPIQISLFSSGDAASKKKAMQKILSEKVDFNSLACEYSYRPKKEYGIDFIWSYIGKKALIEHELKENDDFVKRKEEEWPHRTVVINTNEKIQVVGFEIFKNNLFSSPLYVLKCFANKLNENLQEFGWQVVFEPIIDTQAFWNVIETNSGSIKSLKFTYYVPNLFGTNDALTQELDDAKKNYSAQKVETELVNDHGNLIVPKSAFVEQSIKHIQEGGGKYVVTLKDNRAKFSSESESKIVNIKEARIQLDDQEAMLAILEQFFNT